MSVMTSSRWHPVFSTKAVAVNGSRCLTWVEVFTGKGQVGCGLYQLIASSLVCLVPQIGLFDLEVNCLTKILFGALVVVSLVMVALQHFAGRWYLQIIRFLLLFSNIIPIR